MLWMGRVCQPPPVSHTCQAAEGGWQQIEHKPCLATLFRAAPAILWLNVLSASLSLCCRLEQQLLQWLGSLDLISVTDTPDWSCLSHDIASGVLLAEVAAAVGAGPAVGIQERPVTAAARAGNIQAVLDVLQQLPGLQCR